jgi:hypothetical protein
MNRGRVGEERGSKETDGCPLTGGRVALLQGWMKGLVEGVAERTEVAAEEPVGK